MLRCSWRGRLRALWPMRSSKFRQQRGKRLRMQSRRSGGFHLNSGSRNLQQGARKSRMRPRRPSKSFSTKRMSIRGRPMQRRLKRYEHAQRLESTAENLRTVCREAEETAARLKTQSEQSEAQIVARAEAAARTLEESAKRR